jgi:hypothetical protein
MICQDPGGIVINWLPRTGSGNQDCGVTDPDTKEIFLDPQLCLFHKNLIHLDLHV